MKLSAFLTSTLDCWTTNTTGSHEQTPTNLPDACPCYRRCAGLRHLTNGLCRANANRYQNFVINWVHFGTLIVIFVKIGTVKATFYRTMKINF